MDDDGGGNGSPKHGSLPEEFFFFCFELNIREKLLLPRADWLLIVTEGGERPSRQPDTLACDTTTYDLGPPEDGLNLYYQSY